MVIKIIIYFILINLILSLRKKQSNALYCGIFGFISEESKFDINKIKILFLYNYDRGEDSCGFYTPTSGITKKKGKVVENLHEFVIPEDLVLLGHTRNATVGAITDENSHPFEYKDILCVHNGFIKDWKDVMLREGISTEGITVDSQGFTKMIGEIGLHKTIESLPGSAIATIIYNKVEKVFYVYRNKERPLFRGVLDGGTYISSTEESLKAIGCTKVKEFKENYLYTIKNDIVESSIKVVAKELPKERNGIFHWVMYVSGYYSSSDLTNMKWYKVLDVDGNYINIEDDKGKRVSFTEYYLKGGGTFKPGETIVAMQRLETGTGKNAKILGEPGDKFKFLNYEFEKGEGWKVVWEHPDSKTQFVSKPYKFRRDIVIPDLKKGNIVRRHTDEGTIYKIEEHDFSSYNPVRIKKCILKNGKLEDTFVWSWVGYSAITKIAENEAEYLLANPAGIEENNTTPVVIINPKLKPDVTNLYDEEVDDEFQELDQSFLELINVVDNANKCNAMESWVYTELWESLSSISAQLDELKDVVKGKLLIEK